jgi:hypothetical protein
LLFAGVRQSAGLEKDTRLTMKNRKTTVINWQNSNGAFLTGTFLFYCSLFILLLASAEFFKDVAYSIWGVEAQASISRLVENHSRACIDCNEIDYSYLSNGQTQEVRRTISDRQITELVSNRQLSITYLSILPSNSIFGKTWDDLGITVFSMTIALLGSLLGNALLKGKFDILTEKLPKLKEAA